MAQPSLFERIIFEAPGDPPDLPADDAPPDISSDDSPPDIADDSGDVGGDPAGDEPPDIGGDEFGDEPPEDFGDPESQQNPEEDLELDEKVSAVLNMNLYQRFLSLLNNIGSQLNMIKENSDILYTLSSDSLDTVSSLKKLDENIRLYLNNSFLNGNYSKNLLFFNKCLNLLKLLNDAFEKSIQKGIKAIE